MSIVNIERLTVNVTTANEYVETALGLGQTEANCVPYITKIVTTDTDDNVEDYTTAAFFDGSGNCVLEQRGGGYANRAMTVEIQVVQYDGTDHKVQSGNIQSSSGTSDTDTIPVDVVLANSFLYTSWNVGPTNPWLSPSSLRGRITAEDTVTFDSSSDTQSNKDIYWYVVEAKDGSFTTQELDITIADLASSNTGTLGTSVDSAKSFVVGSFAGAVGAVDDLESGTVDCRLDVGGSVNTVYLDRIGTTGALTWSGHVVTFAGSNNGNVQRGTISDQTDGSEDVDLSAAVDLDLSIVQVAGAHGSHIGGSWAGTNSPDPPDAYALFEFVDSDTIRMTHGTTAGVATSDVSWEVIEWDMGGAPASSRRVMVISS